MPTPLTAIGYGDNDRVFAASRNGTALNNIVSLFLNTIEIPLTSHLETPGQGQVDYFKRGTSVGIWETLGYSSRRTILVGYKNRDGTTVSTTQVTGTPWKAYTTFPTQTTSYYVTATNAAGMSQQSTTVTVTQNTTITGFRKTRSLSAPPGATFYFTATIKGYPQPTLSYRFGNGTQGTITPRHLTPVSGQTNTWTLDWSKYHSVITDSLVLTATNSSNTTTATISNINN